MHNMSLFKSLCWVHIFPVTVKYASEPKSWIKAYLNNVAKYFWNNAERIKCFCETQKKESGAFFGLYIMATRKCCNVQTQKHFGGMAQMFWHNAEIREITKFVLGIVAKWIRCTAGTKNHIFPFGLCGKFIVPYERNTKKSKILICTSALW